MLQYKPYATTNYFFNDIRTSVIKYIPWNINCINIEIFS